jgi:hypothetical protein
LAAGGYQTKRIAEIEELERKLDEPLINDKSQDPEEEEKEE